VPAVRALPWLQIVTIARVVLTELGEDIPPRDRRRLAELVRFSKGDPRRLSTAERREVLRILRQVDVPRLSRAVAKAGATTKLLKR
jgi:hypothetical protein